MAVLLVPIVHATLEDAWAASADGDVIEIVDGATYTLAASLGLPPGETRTLRGTGPARPTLTGSASPLFGDGWPAGHLVLERVILRVAGEYGINGPELVDATECDLLLGDGGFVIVNGGRGTLTRCRVAGQLFEDAGALNLSACLLEAVYPYLLFTEPVTVAHCTFVDCGATGPLLGGFAHLPAVTNCLFLRCSTDGDYLVDGSDLAGNHAADCVAGVAPFHASGASTGNTTGAVPFEADGLTPSPFSPLAAAGVAGAVERDLLGNLFGPSPTKGAFEVAVLLSASAESPNLIRAAFSAPVAPASITDLAAWTVAGGPAGEVSPLAVVLDEGDKHALIVTWPSLSPGCAYAVTALGARVPVRALLAPPQSAALEVPAGFVGEAPPEQGLIAAFTSAVGRELQALAGRPLAVLVRDFGPGDTLLHLDSTFGFPPAGAVHGGGVHLTYTGRTDGALTGVTSRDRTRTIPRRTTFVLDTEAVAPDEPTRGALSQLDRAWRSTLVHRAEAEDLDSLADVYGIPRPRAVDRASWRKLLGELALGPRGLPRGTLAFLVAALDAYHERLAVELRPEQSTRLYAAAGAFEQRHVGRWVLVEGEVYRIVGPADVAATSAGAWVELCDVKTAYWRAANWSMRPAPVSAEATVLAFTYETTTPGPIRDDVPRGTYFGRPANLDVWVWEDRVGRIPPTFLLEAGADRPPGQPLGGHLLEGADVAGDQVHGPFPIYLWDPQVLTPVEKVLDLLTAAQVTVRFLRRG